MTDRKINYDSFLTSKANDIQKVMRVSSNQSVTFNIFMPYFIFCGIVSQFIFDRERNVKFWYELYN